MDYDPSNDRLYVTFTNGTVGVYDNYLDGPNPNPNTAVPYRTITLTDSVNLHGIVHDPVNNVLLLSDVGTATGLSSATDGKLCASITFEVRPAATWPLRPLVWSSNRNRSA